MKAPAAVGLGVCGTRLKRLLARVDEQERIVERLDECVKATNGRARPSSEGA
jgi:hypothetical protein